MLGRIRGRSKEDEEDLEALRRRTAARLAAIVGISSDEQPEEDLGPESTAPEQGVASTPNADPEPDADGEGALELDRAADEAAVDDAASDRVGDVDADGEPGDAVADPVASASGVPAPTGHRMDDAGPVADFNADLDEDAPLAAFGTRERAASEPVTLPERVVPVMAASAQEPAAGAAAASGSAAPVMGAASTSKRDLPMRRTPPAKPKARRRKGSTLLPAACPSCGVVLDELPTASRRCVACRQRMVVRRIEGRTVLLAEAVAPFFDSHRRQLVSGERIKREAGRWLQMAALAGAAPEVLEARAMTVAAKPKPEAVAGARALYATTVERAVRAARKGHDWRTVADLRFRQARAYYRAGGSRVPVDETIGTLQREAVDASLRRVRESASDAVLVGGTCCEGCRAATGRVVRIAAERREPSLPHADCSAGLCGCRWDVPADVRQAAARPKHREATPAGASAGRRGG